MDELISRADALAVAMHSKDPVEGIKNLPAADAVEVVRCKDCIYAREMDKYEKQLYLDECVGCTRISVSYHSFIMSPTDFCSYGERKE